MNTTSFDLALSELDLSFAKEKVVEKPSTNLIRVDRYLLSQTWYNLLTKLAGKHPNVFDQAMINMAYNKIVTKMQQMTDEELLQDMQDIVDAVDFARLSILPPKEGYYKR